MAVPIKKKTETKQTVMNISESRHVPFAVVEAYKAIRTNLTFLLAASDTKVFGITSPEAGEGKSTTSVNMAIAFSQLGDKVLLVDADMRKSSIDSRNTVIGCIPKEQIVGKVFFRIWPFKKIRFL